MAIDFCILLPATFCATHTVVFLAVMMCMSFWACALEFKPGSWDWGGLGAIPHSATVFQCDCEQPIQTLMQQTYVLN